MAREKLRMSVVCLLCAIVFGLAFCWVTSRKSSRDAERQSVGASIAEANGVYVLPSTSVGVAAVDLGASEDFHCPDLAAVNSTISQAGLDAHNLRRGVCHGSSTSKRGVDVRGTATNMPRKIASDAAQFSGTLYMLAQPSVSRRFGSAQGMRLVVVNGTHSNVAFDSCDNRLSIIQEAKDRDGVWRAIETLPDSACYASYFQVYLGAGEYWEFPVPRYVGGNLTQLRFRLNDHNENPLLYSNEFTGGVNAEQFEVPEPQGPGGTWLPYPDVPGR